MSARASSRDWRQDYRDLEWMTEDDLASAMAELRELEPDVIAKLAQGPKSYRYGCAVCDAFGEAYYKHCPPDPDDPKWRAFAYHEIPKKDMFHANSQFYGPLANDTYVRCIATYRAAGWTGEAQEPNA